MLKIFISYRRADSESIVGRMYDWLEREFGDKAIFKDTDNIPAGVDFPDELKEQVQQSAVMLVIIGSKWVNIKTDDGTRRLEHPTDYVRQEIEMGLSNENCEVIPVLIGNTPPLKVEDIPQSIRDILRKNNAEIREDPDFRRDIARLIKRVKQIQPAFQQQKKKDSVKELIFDETKKIELHQYMNNLVQETYKKITSDEFLDERQKYLNGDGNDFYSDVIELYFRELTDALSEYSIISVYGKDAHAKYVIEAIEQFSRGEEAQLGIIWRFLPSLILLYVSGMSAIQLENWSFLAKILNKFHIDYSYAEFKETSLTTLLSTTYLSYERRKIKQNYRIGHYLESHIKSVLNDANISNTNFEYHFDLLEMILALSFLQDRDEEDSLRWMPPSVSHINKRSWGHLMRYWKDVGKEGDNWTLIQNEIFSDYETVCKLLGIYIDTAHRFQQGWDIAFFHDIHTPNFQSIYEGDTN